MVANLQYGCRDFQHRICYRIISKTVLCCSVSDMSYIAFICILSRDVVEYAPEVSIECAGWYTVMLVVIVHRLGLVLSCVGNN